MLFRRQNDPATSISTTAPATGTTKPLTAPAKTDNNAVRTAPLTATPTPPIAQAQQRRMITTPNGNFSLPSNNSGTSTGTRKLQVGRDITLNGEIGACDHLAIEGTVTATIKHLQQFDILDYGQFSGSVTAENADINGTFDGDLTVTGRLWLRSNAVVNGTIKYAALQVEKGACLRGTVDMIATAAPQQTGTTFSSTNDALTAAND